MQWIKLTRRSRMNSTMSSVFFMSGIFSSRFARRWAKVPSIYRYFLRFRSASIKAALSQRQHQRTREHLETVSMDPQPLHQALPDRFQRFPGDDKQWHLIYLACTHNKRRLGNSSWIFLFRKERLRGHVCWWIFSGCRSHVLSAIAERNFIICSFFSVSFFTVGYPSLFSTTCSGYS